jgi:hypothetical protein
MGRFRAGQFPRCLASLPFSIEPGGSRRAGDRFAIAATECERDAHPPSCRSSVANEKLIRYQSGFGGFSSDGGP